MRTMKGIIIFLILFLVTGFIYRKCEYIHVYEEQNKQTIPQIVTQEINYLIEMIKININFIQERNNKEFKK